MDDKVIVTSMTNGAVGLTYNEMHFHREWPKRGAKVLIDKNLLREAIYSPGINTLFTEGLLYIEDLEFKKELGLEAEDAEEPTNIIPLDEKTMRRMLTVMPLHEFKEKIATLSEGQRYDLAQYAIKNELLDLEKSRLIKEYIGVDVIKAAQLAKDAFAEEGKIE